MGRLIEKDGKSYRVRRGRLVEIPPKRVGTFASPQTIAKRPSKAIHKLRKKLKYGRTAWRGVAVQQRRADAGRKVDDRNG